MHNSVSQVLEFLLWSVKSFLDKTELETGHQKLRIFLSTTWISSTKLKFRWSFWGAQQVYIWIGSKVMTKMQRNKKTNKKGNKEKKGERRNTNHKFFTKLKKKKQKGKCVLCHNFWVNHYIDLFRTSKWLS